MTDENIHIIGDNPRKSRYDPNLANEFNKQVEDEERKRLLDEKLGRTRPREPETPISAPSLDGFIYVPSIGIYVAKERTLNGKSWDEAIDEIYAKGINVGEKRAEMPTPFEFMTSLNYLLSGDIPNLPENEKESILDDILKVGDYRGNHLNALFVEHKDGAGGLGMESAIFDSRGKVKRVVTPLEPHIRENKYADLRVFNKQGLLTKLSSNQDYRQGENTYVYYPEKGRVARFNAGSGRAYLDCSRNRAYANDSLGVRLVVREAPHAQSLEDKNDN